MTVAVEQLHAAQLPVLNELGPELEVEQRPVPRPARAGLDATGSGRP
jgi:hypothetical protein